MNEAEKRRLHELLDRQRRKLDAERDLERMQREKAEYDRTVADCTRCFSQKLGVQLENVDFLSRKDGLEFVHSVYMRANDPDTSLTSWELTEATTLFAMLVRVGQICANSEWYYAFQGLLPQSPFVVVRMSADVLFRECAPLSDHGNRDFLAATPDLRVGISIEREYCSQISRYVLTVGSWGLPILR